MPRFESSDVHHASYTRHDVKMTEELPSGSLHGSDRRRGASAIAAATSSADDRRADQVVTGATPRALDLVAFVVLAVVLRGESLTPLQAVGAAAATVRTALELWGRIGPAGTIALIPVVYAVACALAGASQPPIRTLAAYVEATGGQPQASLLGFGRRTGTAIRQLAERLHPSLHLPAETAGP